LFLSNKPAERQSAREVLSSLGALPLYEEWDETSALSWWESWAVRRNGKSHPPSPSEAPSPDGLAHAATTMTVDLRGRT
jgi:hypothetical protein